MAVTGIITLGIGPAGNVSDFITLGLSSGEAAPATITIELDARAFRRPKGSSLRITRSL